MQRFKVSPDGGEPYELVTGSRDVLVWEKTNRTGRTAVSLTEGASLMDQYAIAYLGAKRQGLFTGTREEFDSTCELEALGEEEEPDPTPPAP